MIRFVVASLCGALCVSVTAAPYVFVAESRPSDGTIQVIPGTLGIYDAATGKQVADSIPVDPLPVAIANAKTREHTYVLSRKNYGKGTLTIISTATREVVASVTVGAGASGLLVSPDDRIAYVSNADSSSPATVSIIDLEKGQKVDEVAGDLPSAISPDGRTLYGGNGASLVKINAATFARTLIATDDLVGPIAPSPDGRHLYIANTQQYPGTFMQLQGSDTTISVLSTELSRVEQKIEVGQGPSALALSADGTFLYVWSRVSATISVIDTRIRKEIQRRVVPIADTYWPPDLAVSADGATLIFSDTGAKGFWRYALVDGLLTTGELVPTATFPYAVALRSGIASTSVPPIAYIVAERIFPSDDFNEGPRLFAIDMRTDDVVGGPYSLGKADDQPSGTVATSPGGRYVYAGLGRYAIGTPGGNNDHFIAVFDTQLRKLVRAIDVRPPVFIGATGGMAVTPDGGTLYAYSNGYDTTNNSKFMAVVSLPSGKVRQTILMPASSGRFIVVSPNGNLVVTPVRENLPDSGLAFIDSDTGAITATIPIPSPIGPVQFSPDSRFMYVVTVEAGQGKLLRVDLRTLAIVGSLSLVSPAYSLGISSDGRRLYTTHAIAPAPATMSVINVDLWQIVANVNLGPYPYPGGLAVAPTGEKVYVSMKDAVVVVSTVTNAVTKTIDVPARWNILAPVTGTMMSSVEFFHAQFGHYFTTNSGIEVDKIDTGDFTGWTRTGERFGVHPTQAAGTVSVCRYFADAFAGKSSHFYAPRGLGCEEVASNPDWRYEGDVYYVRLPDASGSCPSGHVPVYRLYNNGAGGAPNHRFTASLATRQQMLALGFIAEGAGPGVGFCAPQ